MEKIACLGFPLTTKAVKAESKAKLNSQESYDLVEMEAEADSEKKETF